MNPLRWVRWKVLIAFALVGGLLYFLGLNPLARWQINSLGTDNPSARWKVAEVGLGLLSGDFELRDLLVATARAEARKAQDAGAGAGKEPAAPEDKVFNATLTHFDVSMNEALRKRFVVDLVQVTAPRMDVARRPDGSTNVGDLGGEPDEKPDASGPTDWVETAKKWYERLRKIREKLGGGDDDEKAPPGKEKKDVKGHYKRRAAYAFAERPGVVLRRIVADGLEVAFSETSTSGDGPSGDGNLTTLKDGALEITGLSDKPRVHDQPITMALKGSLAGAPLSLAVNVDLRAAGDQALTVDVDSGALPANVVEGFVGESLPVRLSQGEIGVKANLRLGLDQAEMLLVEPRLVFRNVRLEAKDPAGKIAGLKAADFTKAFNEASATMGDEPLEIADLRITGSLDRPRFEWGDTVKNLVLQGGQAFARGQLAKARSELEGKVGAEVEKALGKETTKKIKEILPGDGTVEDTAKKGLDLLKGLGGSREKKKGQESKEENR